MNRPLLKSDLLRIAPVATCLALWIGVSWFFMLPPICREEPRSSEYGCLECLSHVLGAKQTYAHDKNLTNGSHVTAAEILPYTDWVTIPEFATNSNPRLRCSWGGRITLNPIGVNPTCSDTNVPRKKFRTTKFRYEWNHRGHGPL